MLRASAGPVLSSVPSRKNRELRHTAGPSTPLGGVREEEKAGGRTWGAVRPQGAGKDDAAITTCAEKAAETQGGQSSSEGDQRVPFLQAGAAGKQKSTATTARTGLWQVI